MKARYPMACEHCKVTISTGSQVAIFHGRPWIPAHLIEYQRTRRNVAASAR